MEFLLLNKSEKAQWMPALFDLLHHNMSRIAPSGLSYNDERDSWISEVSSGLEKDPRQIILCLNNGELIGYLQYYVRNEMLMIEEFQISKEFQHSNVFYSFLRFLAASLLTGIETIEAYADKRNQHSIDLMEKIGMVNCDADRDSMFVHMRGSVSKMVFAQRLLKTYQK